MEVRVQHTFAASPDTVFDAWVDPDRLEHWLFEHTGLEEERVRLVTEPFVGGYFSFVVRRPVHGELDHNGEYLEIFRPRRLVFTWGIAGHGPSDSVVSIDIVPCHEGAQLTLVHEMTQPEFAARTEAGWAKLLGALEVALDQGAHTAHETAGQQSANYTGEN